MRKHRRARKPKPTAERSGSSGLARGRIGRFRLKKSDMAKLLKKFDDAQIKELVNVRNLTLMRMDTGKLWLVHRLGEGMEMSAKTEAEFNQVLDRFFDENF